MKKQIAYNVFFYLGIFVSIIGLKWALQHNHVPAIILFIATGIFFIYLKIKLIKDLRKTIKDRTN